ncbi:MAG: tail fiber protein [Thermoleophilaceae bacterium]|nr:tail fiber protein [Thermoleophilaceae bacterium]
MSVITTRRGLPTPLPADPFDIPAHLLALATLLDNDATITSGTHAVRPANAAVHNALYYETDTGTTFYDDGAVWRVVGKRPPGDIAMAELAAEVWPVGIIVPTVSSTAPNYWLMADGTAVSRTTYAALMAEATIARSGTRTSGNATITGLSKTSDLYVGEPIEGTGIAVGATVATIVSASSITMSATATSSGTATMTFFPHGNGNGSTTFGLPDPRGRAMVGAGAGSGLTVRGLGQKMGTESHTLAASEVPNHTHDLNGPNDIGSSIRTTDWQGAVGHSGFGGMIGRVDTSNSYWEDISVVATTGGGGSHNNIQPSLATNFMIKT